MKTPSPLFALVPCVLLRSVAAAAAPGDAAETLSVPCRYPAGLAWHEAQLYVLDWREAKIHAISTEDGAIQQSFDAPTLRPHGLTCSDDGRLYVSDDHSGWIYCFNPQTGVVENSFKAPGPNPAGLAWAGKTLYLLEQKSDQIYELIPEDGTILKIFAAPTKSCSTLAWDGAYLWAADRISDEFYAIDPQQGQVVTALPAPGPYPAGIAFRNGDLWNVDFQERKLYRLPLQSEQPFRLSETRRARVEYLWGLYNYGPGAVRSLTVNLALPQNLPQQALLSEPHFSMRPTRLETDRWGQRCAVFELDGVPAGQRQTVGYHIEARVSAIRYVIFPDRCGTLADIPAEIREKYTADGSRYRLDSAFIRDTVQAVVGEESNPYWIARKIFNYIIGKLEYEMVGGWDVPEVVLKRGTGSCSEYTFTFIALCRAAGLPARYQGGVVVRGDDASIDEAHHRWAEVYLPNYGWVPVDANAGDKDLPAEQARAFGGLPNRFLITTQSGGDSAHLAWGYNAHHKYQATGFCRIEQESLGFWEPLGDEENGPEESSAPQPADAGDGITQ
jgi:transglutaminase-like putative cysteine protease